MDKKKTTQTLAGQWAAYLYLKKETELCIPAMDAMRHAAAIRMWEYLHRKKLPGKRNASRKKDIPGEQFLVYRFVAKPTKEQEQFLRQSAGNCRFLWNQIQQITIQLFIHISFCLSPDIRFSVNIGSCLMFFIFDICHHHI